MNQQFDLCANPSPNQNPNLSLNRSSVAQWHHRTAVQAQVRVLVRAVAYREPANIVGDGISTLEQLIDRKNVGRGDDYKFPLLKIKVDDEVTRHLNAQSLTIHSVVPSEEKIYLRKNSNLSTGGDSIDVTDTMPSFYKEVAVKAAGAAGLKIAGVEIGRAHV